MKIRHVVGVGHVGFIIS